MDDFKSIRRRTSEGVLSLHYPYCLETSVYLGHKVTIERGSRRLIGTRSSTSKTKFISETYSIRSL